MSRGGLSWIVVFVLMLLIWGFFTKVFLGVLLVVICIFTFVLFSGCGLLLWFVICGLSCGIAFGGLFAWCGCCLIVLFRSFVLVL